MISLALSVHSNPGLYALLLGSGVSRAAAIPTGWDVVLDLIRKVAHLQNQDPEPHPDEWYRREFRKEPDYSELLELLAQSPAERSTLLRGYFEPTEREREEGKKTPTTAHRAIASLVRRGYVRVIATTNFDRLMEQALEGEGIVPTVISSADQFLGALPLQHNRCTILKIHGDYLDTRIKNTPAELAKYDAAIDSILDRVFLEYGLVVCGWSADWDVALLDAVMRCPRYQFGWFWAAHGAPGANARRLIEFRRSSIVPIVSADDFFSGLEEKVTALEMLAGSSPLSAEMFASTVKRYMAEDRFRIRLHDVVVTESTRLRQLISNPPSSVDEDPTPPVVTERVRRFEALTTQMVPAFVAAGYWSDVSSLSVWTAAIARVSEVPRIDGSYYDVWVGLRRYPALILAYAVGLGALAARSYAVVGRVLEFPIPQQGQSEPEPLATHLLPEYVFNGRRNDGLLIGHEKQFTPISERLFELLKPSLQQYTARDRDYEKLFDEFEILVSLTCGHHSSSFCDGRFRWKSRRRMIDVIGITLDFKNADVPADWPPLRSGMFGGTKERASELIRKLREAMAHW